MDLKSLASTELKMPKLRRPKLGGTDAEPATPEVAAPSVTALQEQKPASNGAQKASHRIELGSLRDVKLHKPSMPSLQVPFKRSGGGTLVGLDIEPGRAVAVRVSRQGETMCVEQSVVAELPAGVVREGDVADPEALGAALKEMFEASGLPKRVRVGMAGQRSVMRVLSLPPISDKKELAAAVRFTAEKEMPMPLSVAVTDFHPVGEVETPAGMRQRVVFVAAHREPVTKLLDALRRAGISTSGIDLSAFALIRALHTPPEVKEDGEAGDSGDCFLYANIDGLTNIAIADGTTCLFTRTATVGLESMAAELAARAEIELEAARKAVDVCDLTLEPDAGTVDAQIVVGDGMREVAVEVRTALDFHRSQQEGLEVKHIVLSGGAASIPGFAEQLSEATAMPVEVRAVDVAAGAGGAPGDAGHMAIAAGLAVAEAPR